VTGSTANRESLIRGQSGRKLRLATTGTLTFATGQFALSPLLPSIIESLDISRFAAGIAMSMMFGITAVVRYPGGRLSDDLSRKTVIVAGLIVLIGGFSLLTAVQGYPSFVVGVTVVGIGIGLYSSSAVAWLSDLFIDKQGQALGVNNGSIYLAGILGALLATAALRANAWRSAFLPIVIALVALVPAVHVWNDEPYRFGRPEFDVRGTVARLLQSTRVRRMLVIGALFGISWQGAITFLPDFLQAEKAISATFANNLFALLFAIGIGSNLLAGRIADRFSVPLLISAVAATTAGGLVGIIYVEHHAVLIANIVVLGAGLAAIWPALQSYMMNLFPDDSKGGDFGAFSTGYGVIASLGPSIVGFIVDQLSFTIAFLALACCLLLSAVLAIQLERWD